MFRQLAPPPPPLNLGHLPPTFLFKARLTMEKRKELREKLRACRCRVADAATDASLFIGDINTPKRCEMELRRVGIIVSAAASQATIGTKKWTIQVVKLSWFTKSLEKGQIEPLEPYTLLIADVQLASQTRMNTPASSPTAPPSELAQATEKKRKEILERAKADAEESPAPKRARYGGPKGVDSIVSITKKAPLIRQTTPTPSPERDTEERPEPPEWVKTKNTYSCCRSTPRESPNALFISQLKVIKHSRIIGGDQIGVRAYSTAIAVIQAYPYPLRSASEVVSLPGCGGKLARLFDEWKSSDPEPEKRMISSVKELEESRVYQTLKNFESIWGIGADTAAKLYYEHDYRTLDDIIKQHWSKLSNVQKIGLKYHEDFSKPIPRREVEQIAALIQSHAEAIIPGVQSMIVGGYRRGKEECGDVDILLSHQVEGTMDSDFLWHLLKSLENAELITNTLSISTQRLQQEDPNRSFKSHSDSLDKALLIWQTDKGGLRRRVDIIIAPTICAGTALLGWTGAATFERDLRLYCEKERGWKFSSEGVWKGNERVPGTFGWREEESWEDVEKRVMEIIGVGWRPPTERCTG
ncbi:hypothetical protein FN846DRAFT_892941 [Sphaerosporella brunnea]|uniref:DNA polymerase n=1 Tax=Sphaerosporella brunnea TaxID=1250544 RepID=A0A5J5ENQ0_9PEZI|nr:hypothetical protein FN846DRAFT_892941 [Sphaerosporella brunnea]